MRLLDQDILTMLQLLCYLDQRSNGGDTSRSSNPFHCIFKSMSPSKYQHPLITSMKIKQTRPTFDNKG